MLKLSYQTTNFLRTVPDIKFLPPDCGSEIAFIGYSNVGKSSLINALTKNIKLARYSRIPGCTQYINIFEISPGKRLIDLSGYGYTKFKIKNQVHIADQYLKIRKCLTGLVILIDIRRSLRLMDHKILKWTTSKHFPILVGLNKSDKLSESTCRMRVKAINQEIAMNFNKDVYIYPISILKNKGINTIKKKISSWLIR